MNFFGIGFPELVFILIVALLVMGPNRMVGAARTFGKYMRELQRAASEVPRLLSLEGEGENQTPSPQRQQIPKQQAGERENPDSGA